MTARPFARRRWTAIAFASSPGCDSSASMGGGVGSAREGSCHQRRQSSTDPWAVSPAFERNGCHARWTLRSARDSRPTRTSPMKSLPDARSWSHTATTSSSAPSSAEKAKSSSHLGARHLGLGARRAAGSRPRRRRRPGSPCRRRGSAGRRPRPPWRRPSRRRARARRARRRRRAGRSSACSGPRSPGSRGSARRPP